MGIHAGSVLVIWKFMPRFISNIFAILLCLSTELLHGQAEVKQIGLLAANAFSQRGQTVAVEGYVVSWTYESPLLVLRLISAESWTIVTVQAGAQEIPADFHGAKLRLTGTNGTFSRHGETVHVPAIQQMQVLEAGVADPYAVPQISIADLNARKLTLARRVRVRGVLTAIMEKRKYIIQDDTDTAILLADDPRIPGDGGKVFDESGLPAGLQVGDVIEAVGSAMEQPLYAMKTYSLLQCHLRRVGSGSVPPPREVTLDTLLAYRNEAHWVTFEAVVHSWMLQPGSMNYNVGDQGTWLNLSVRNHPLTPLPKNLFGARVRFTGVASGLSLNFRGADMIVPDPGFMQIIQPGLESPFQAPAHGMAEIATRRSPKGVLISTKGVVVGQGRNVLYVRNADAAICLTLHQPWPRPGKPPGIAYGDTPLPTLAVGDEVEVAGYQLTAPNYAPFDLADASVRATGRRQPVEPVETTLARISAGEHTSDLVKVRARLLTMQTASVGNGQWHTTFLLTAAGHRMTAVHQSTTLHPFDTLKQDDDLIIQAAVDRETPENPRLLWIFTPAEVKSLGTSPEVIMRRFWLWAGAALLGISILAAWVLLLRRTQREQARVNAELTSATEAARASEQRWKLFFEQSPLSVQIFDPDGQTKLFNNAWRRLFQLSDEQGLAFNVLKAPDLIASGAVAHIQKAFEGQVVQVPPVPYPIPGDPPETRWIGGTLYPLKNTAGVITEVVVIHHDITETKRAEDAMLAMNQTLEKSVHERTTELQKAQAELERALEQERELGELKSRFVTMVSHEFRTPLGIIMSAVELLQHYSDRLPEDEKQRQLQEIQSSTKHMGGLMEQVLLLGRAEAGKLTCKPTPLDLICFAERIIDETQSISNRKCPIKLITEGDITNAAADEALLRHILGNLVANAVKYSPAGEEVVLSLRREGPNAAFAVIDRGIGIPEKDRARLFEAFHRCSNVGDTPGTGLGLVIVKRCVDLHGGILDVESETGRGSTFTVRLPVFI
jgi:PAS domain S-box-containing protein